MKISQNIYARVDKLRRAWYPPPGYLGYPMYKFLMAWAIRTIYTSKCVPMEPQQLPKTSKSYSICNKCDMQKTVPPPW